MPSQPGIASMAADVPAKLAKALAEAWAVATAWHQTNTSITNSIRLRWRAGVRAVRRIIVQ
ncbi:hypothetical protein GCM10027188_22110 [Lysobacter humi (ex Lee et al. 2017)]